MKKCKILCALVMSFLVTTLASCSKDDFNTKYFTATSNKQYQLHDKFSKYDLKVKYKELDMLPEDFNVDLSGFDSSKIGESSIYVSPIQREEVNIEVKVDVGYCQKANILSFGNSLNEDSMYYLQGLASMSSTVDSPWGYQVFLAEIKDSTLEDHCHNFTLDDQLYELKRFNNETYLWETIGNKSFLECLNNEGLEWDYIIFEDDACKAGQVTSMASFNTLAKNINRLMVDKRVALPNILYQMPFAYADGIQVDASYYQLYNNSQEAMYNAITNSCKNVVSTSAQIDQIIPTGTFIQNLRANGLYTDGEISGISKNIQHITVKFACSILFASYISGQTVQFFIDHLDETTKSMIDPIGLLETKKAIEEALLHPYQVSIYN